MQSIPVFSYEITQNNLYKHVNYLSSDSLQGRLTGTKGEKLATQYIANEFQRLGLEPAGDHGTFFQDFSFTAGVTLAKNNSFSISTSQGVTRNLRLNQDWRPLAFSDSVIFANKELIFAGYGITAPGYDSYHSLNVNNKWVVVFRDVPDKLSLSRTRELSHYAALRYKAFTAKEHGAIGIIFVNGPKSTFKNKLIPHSYDTSMSNSGIVALAVKNNIRDDLLKNNGSELNSFKLSGQINLKKNIRHGRNVLAKMKNGANKNSMLVVAAHIDHLGHGEVSGSRARDTETGMIHPGADDNASGVASLVETAAMLSAMKAQGKLHGNKDILFAAWSGEEIGILGSTHFVNHFIQHAPNKALHPAIEAIINLDMIGHLRAKLVVQGVGSSLDWTKIIKTSNANHFIALVTQRDPYLPTDSTVFYINGVPGLNLFTGAHDDYHTPRDKADTLNYAGIKTISEFVINMILSLDASSHLIKYHEVQKSNDTPEREFKIYLGTIPDYSSSDTAGVKLSGVAKNSPAAKAGLKHDDIIIELAGTSIHDIYDYTYVLNALHVGVPASLIVQRGEAKVLLTIIPRSRE